MKKLLLLLALVSTSTLACDLYDIDCAAREERLQRQIEENRIEAEATQRQYEYEMERQRQYDESMRWKQEQERQQEQQHTAQDSIRDFYRDKN